jgi:hypothetical protein
MSPWIVVGFTVIIMLLSWAIGFLSGALWLWGRERRALLREGDVGARDA